MGGGALIKTVRGPRPPSFMGSHLLQFLNSFPLPIYHNHSLISFSNKITVDLSRFSGSSRCDWHTRVNHNKRSRFSDAFVTDDNDEEGEFRFRSATAQKRWWSEDFFEDDENDDDEGFGFFRGAVALSWISKVFEAFGWMIPAVIISLVLGNGPDTIIMTLALPFAQSFFSLGTDKLFGRQFENRSPKRKSKKRPFARASNSRVRKRYKKPAQTANDSVDYKSWVTAENVSAKNDKQRDFGGWDELINEVEVDKEPKRAKEEIKEEIIKIRRMKGDSPFW